MQTIEKRVPDINSFKLSDFEPRSWLKGQSISSLIPKKNRERFIEQDHVAAISEDGIWAFVSQTAATISSKNYELTKLYDIDFHFLNRLDGTIKKLVASCLGDAEKLTEVLLESVDYADGLDIQTRNELKRVISNKQADISLLIGGAKKWFLSDLAANFNKYTETLLGLMVGMIKNPSIDFLVRNELIKLLLPFKIKLKQ